ncbi:DMT family transporter [Myroides pelagicus]|uniref:EamA family transporter n=1 Tax=Myroides pelagicus TaxID=270914 RepID=A0A7K1GL16_9FLAO|nr:DMT family transporter [Myroides pelagicus]MEC4112582.1 DMT family transporter [Myroides pelagicus]MTH29541.1 EamA family transporter [Myroides pelagicus]
MLSKPRIALIIGILCISIFPVIVKMSLTPSLISAFYRMAIALVFVLPYALLTKQFKVYNKNTMLLIVLSGVFFGSDIAVWNQAIQGSTATQATLLTNLAPVWVGVGSYFFLTNKPSLNFWIGTVVALVGMVVLVGADVFMSLSFDLPFGLGVLSGILYACYILVSKRILEEVAVVPFMTYSLLVSSVFLGVINWLGGSSFTGFSTAGWATLFVQGIVCQLLAWLLLSYATKYMRATRVSLSLLSQALLAALLAWGILDEEVTRQMVLGGFIILCGIAITFVERPLWYKRK